MSKRRKQLTPLHLRKSRQAILGNDRVKAWNKFDFCTDGYQNLQGQILPNRTSDNMSSYSNYTSTTSTWQHYHDQLMEDGMKSHSRLHCDVGSNPLASKKPYQMTPTVGGSNVESQASTNHWTPSTFVFYTGKTESSSKGPAPDHQSYTRLCFWQGIHRKVIASDFARTRILRDCCNSKCLLANSAMMTFGDEGC